MQRILDVLHQDFKDIELPEVIKMSKDDRKALEIFEESVEKKDDHYTIALPWKDKNTSLPNKKMAEKRLLGLKRKLIANEDMYEKCSSKIKEYIDCGYVELVTNEESNSKKMWYIPHHYVNSSNKFCIVFDCSAKFDGVSLNDKLLQGPDLSNNLLGVFLRFREEPIAVVGDIHSMFHPVFVSEKDRDALRFLWYQDGDLEKPLATYCMKVHLFGSTSLPSVASFALRRTAEDNETNTCEKVIHTVYKNFYVDDLCKSFSTVEEAVEMIKQLCT